MNTEKALFQKTVGYKTEKNLLYYEIENTK